MIGIMTQTLHLNIITMIIELGGNNDTTR
jgi:hypothetical protein